MLRIEPVEQLDEKPAAALKFRTDGQIDWQQALTCASVSPRLRHGHRSYALGKVATMKSATRVTSKGQVVIPKPMREQLRWTTGTQLAVDIMGDGAVRLAPLEAENPIDALYGCLKDSPRDPLAELEAEHRAEIQADERWQHRGR